MIITQSILEEVLKPENRKSDLNPMDARLSGIGYCMRKEVLSALEGAPPIEWEYSYGGKLLQEEVTKLIEKKYPVIREYPVKHPYGTGHIDCMIDKGIVSEVCHIVEIKSSKCAALEKLEDGSHRYALPKITHMHQVRAQMMFLGKEEGLIPTAEILYVCRDHLLEHHYSFEISYPDEETQSFIHKWLSNVKLMKMNKTIPPKLEKPDYQCSYKTKKNGYGRKIEYQEIRCQFFDKCWGSDRCLSD